MIAESTLCDRVQTSRLVVEAERIQAGLGVWADEGESGVKSQDVREVKVSALITGKEP